MNATTEAIGYLITHGFRPPAAGGRVFHHPRAQVRLIDPGVACFTVTALPTGPAPAMGWEAQLTRTPIAVFAATVTAAIATD